LFIFLKVPTFTFNNTSLTIKLKFIMKKKILLFTAIAGIGYISFSSYSSGPALNGQNCTGVNASATSCAGTSGCHNAGGTTTGDSIRVDSAGGVAVNRYVAGLTYTVTVTGWTTGTQTKFGFQFAAVRGTSPTQSQAGTFGGLGGGIVKHTLSSIDYVEHSSTINAGTSAFTKTFTWTAPVAGSGNVGMYLTVNAVNGNGSDDLGDVSKNVQKMLTELVSHAAVADIANAINVLAYPNPVANQLNVQFKEMVPDTYTLNLYDMTGRVLSSKQVEVSGASYITTINTANLATGIYHAVVEKDGNRQVINVVKE
jgi:hypothetical protein